MLNLSEAKAVVKHELPNAVIHAAISYKSEYVFVVYRSNDREGLFDPFYAVDKATGTLREFSVITDGDTDEIMDLFRKSVTFE